ncbi:hypothetical protein HBH70_136570 [Parastagonospora nodorum]|nr:hypothetical protein HBI09_150030 [Parastagonospora nodorum]KAH4056942.1 hypothetical protein HBH49_039380 [Parastagonospora nodorum]KAH4076863.1 hypothetical protein HBH50_011570 [Parastagonospora nodorum]KAH4095658.1 hypothetical protein HBH48_046230 [Parastagonospora nodorum]KAH4197409.1 hypothetical protein HBH42_056710 [Parastagonospora nodorum]
MLTAFASILLGGLGSVLFCTISNPAGLDWISHSVLAAGIFVRAFICCSTCTNSSRLVVCTFDMFQLVAFLWELELHTPQCSIFIFQWVGVRSCVPMSFKTCGCHRE